VSAPSSGIDHTIVGVRDLEGARAAYARLGFTLSPRGSHIGWATANYCMMFAADYVELLGMAGGAGESAGLDRFLARAEGLMGLALKTADAGGASAQLQGLGVAASAPKDLARRLELAEGTVMPRFRLVDVPPGLAPDFKLFLCQHLTPAHLRRPAWTQHANGAQGIQRVTIVVEAPAALASGYRALFGGNAVLAATAESLTVRPETGGHLHFLTPAAFRALAPTADVALAPRGTTLVGTDFRVADPAATARQLATAGIPFRATAHGLEVAARHAAGCLVAFVAA